MWLGKLSQYSVLIGNITWCLWCRWSVRKFWRKIILPIYTWIMWRFLKLRNALRVPLKNSRNYDGSIEVFWISIKIWNVKNDLVDPSPDWIVGVSGLELCLDSCTWIEHKELNLYPYDAGTDNGITYLVKKNSFLKRFKFYFTNFVRYNYFHKNILQTFSWSISGSIRFSPIVANG